MDQISAQAKDQAHGQATEHDGEDLVTDNWLPVPLPNELPPAPDLSMLPAEILHSGTVETLIGQNEDLMSRLKVNIRRNSALERQMMEQERALNNLVRVNQSLESEMQIMQEKEQFLQERAKQTQTRHENIRNLEVQKNRLQSYQRRVRAWVKPYIANLKSEVAATSTRAEVLGAQAAGRDATVGDLRARLNETIVHCQNLEKSRNKDQSKLVDQYEERIQLIETELEKARGELRRTRDKSTRVDEVSKVNVELENRLVLIERRKFESESRLGQELREFQDQVTTYRVEAKTLANELIGAKQTAETLQAENHKIKGDFTRLEDQFESLQIVWTDTQKKLETARIQSESLGRLNQELGRLLKEERRARETAAARPAPTAPRSQTINQAAIAAPLNTAVVSQAANDALSIDERNQQLIDQINDSITAKPIADPKSGNQMPDFIENESERFAKIDNLLAELESGFSMMETDEADSARNHDLLEE